MKIIKDNRFTSVEVEVHFITELSDKLSIRNIVKDLIVDSSLKYNSKQKMRIKLDDMYGATLKASSKVVGKLHDICFSGNVIHDDYTINHEKNIQEYLDFFKEILYFPFFTEEKLEELKIKYIHRLERSKEDVQSYSMKEAIKNSVSNSILNIDPYGDIEKIKDITLEDVKKEYQNMIKEDVIRVIVAGKVENIDFIQDRDSMPMASYLNLKGSLKIETVKKNSDQSFVNIVFNINQIQSEKSFFVGTIANMILGGMDGLLFRNIREKLGLCYIIFSEIYHYDGLLFIHSGVSKENINLCIQEIYNQIDLIKNKKFSDEMLDKAKKAVIHSLKSSNDTLKGKMIKILNQEFRQIFLNDEERIKYILSVTKEDITEYISQMQEIYQYNVEGE